MTIMLVGGGSGGHITPLLAVAHELKRKKPDVRLIYLEEKGGKFAHLVDNTDDLFDDVVNISAGKYRRYPNESKISRIFDVPTHVLNTRDMFRTLIGFNQAKKTLKKYKPDIIFIKGSFVGLPVGKAAAALKIPYITHDSDTVPGLTNRIIAKDAQLNLVGMPEQFYTYPGDKVRYTGIPLAESYTNRPSKSDCRQKLGLPVDGLTLLITGGSLGAQRLNEIASGAVKKLLGEIKDLTVLHQTGKGKGGLYNGLNKTEQSRLKEVEYANDLSVFSGASDVVVARAGATTIYELAVQQKACILVPSIYLAGGHQLENAQYFQSKHAALVVDESAVDAEKQLYLHAKQLLEGAGDRNRLGKTLYSLVNPNAAADIADILLKKAGGS